MPRVRYRPPPEPPKLVDKLIELPKELKMSKCPEDGFVLHGDEWLPFDPLRAAKKAAVIKGEVDNWEIQPAKDGMEVIVNGWLGEGHPTSERHFVKLTYKDSLCNVHQAARGGYFEAILQIRGDWIGENFHYVEHRLEELQRRDRYAFHRDKPVKGGLDVMVGSKQAAWKVAQELKIRFGAELTKSTKLVGMKDSKRIQRLTIAVRFPERKVVPNLAEEEVGQPLFKP